MTHKPKKLKVPQCIVDILNNATQRPEEDYDLETIPPTELHIWPQNYIDCLNRFLQAPEQTEHFVQNAIRSVTENANMISDDHDLHCFIRSSLRKQIQTSDIEQGLITLLDQALENMPEPQTRTEGEFKWIKAIQREFDRIMPTLTQREQEAFYLSYTNPEKNPLPPKLREKLYANDTLHNLHFGNYNPDLDEPA